MKIGFIGLGVMGRPMAQHLIEAGHELFLHRVKPVSAHLVESGATACASAAEVARLSEVIILMLPDTPDVEHVLFGEDGVVPSIEPGKLIIDMSSISPLATKDFAARVEACGCDYLDAPVSGGEVGAKAASLTIMVGGKPDAFERAKALFEKMGKNITLIGGVGDGQIAKVANQIVVALNIQAVSEALSFARKAGADPATVRKALMGGFAASRVLEVHGERMINETFEPGFRLRLHHKDLSLAMDSARLLELMLPNTAMVQQLMNSALVKGLGDKDHSALIEVL
ncbi:2-hydroxy-3-oxopropionate reductase [Rhizobium sp. 0TCS1.26]|uniref:2-hydroxy-3-oxopropionate reductase n=1 Tax=Rhizobium sp. 0TCS1.26 TaxID=3142623 RepID=UPI003D273216